MALPLLIEPAVLPIAPVREEIALAMIVGAAALTADSF
jgi:hypothetical protein